MYRGLKVRRLSDSDFHALRDAYAQMNRGFERAMIFHVGSSSGFYSEVGSMMECMIYCYLHEIRFILYSDDANFSHGGAGWREFFEPFCEENHDRLNRRYNKRTKSSSAVPGSSLRSIKSRLLHYLSPLSRKLLLWRNNADYLTSDFFSEFISPEFKRKTVRWPLFGMDGDVYPEIAKLQPFALRYNAKTLREVEALKEALSLPEKYFSIQIRGGDKIAELRGYRPESIALSNIDRCLRVIEESTNQIPAIFVLSDDYRHVLELKNRRPDWAIFTLTRPDETGYEHASFSKTSWATKRRELVKLFAAVDICISSSTHFGYEYSCVNNIIKPAKDPGTYIPWVAA
jgi:hypothetical protein